MVQSHEKKLDVIDSAVVDVIDRIASLAPSVVNWWEDLVLPASALRREYNESVKYPDSWNPQRPYAYLPFFGPRYLPRFKHVLRAAGLEFTALVKLKKGPVRILDLGAGSGILTIACLLELERACQSAGVKSDVDVVLCDQNQHSLSVAEQFLQLLQQIDALPHLTLGWTSVESNIHTATIPGSFDLVLLGHVLCESYQSLSSEEVQSGLFFDAILDPLFSWIRSKLSDFGVVTIIEPLNANHLSTPLLIRDFLRQKNELTLLAPCLGTSTRCPERVTPYWKTAACSGATHIITWDDSTEAGHRLRLFTEAVLLVRGLTLSLPIPRSCFFPIVLSRGKRDVLPADVGMTVRRVAPSNKTSNIQPVCLVGPDGAERVLPFHKNGFNAKRSLMRAIKVVQENSTDRRLDSFSEFDLSALYKLGWPVVQ
jgi:hypothetical protein